MVTVDAGADAAAPGAAHLTLDPLPWHRPAFERLLGSRARHAHALLLRGPQGIGKLQFARALVAALLCERPGAGSRGCGACAACGWLRVGSHPDYREVSPIASAGAADDEEQEEKEKKEKKGSNVISVEQVRALAELMQVSTHRGGARVILVHPAEALNPSAGNALLKGLEEPPPGTHFILVTHRPHQVLATIRSRCQHVTLTAPEPASAAAWLESQGVSRPQLALAQTGCAPLLARELTGSAYWAQRTVVLRVLAAGDFDIVAVTDVLRDHDAADVLGWLQKWSYDLALFQAAGRVRYNLDEQEAIAAVAARADRLALVRFHREMVRLQRVAHHPLNARLFIEHLLLAYRDVMRAGREGT